MAKISTDKGRAASDLSDQHARFLETARALGCDEDEAAFDEKLKGIVREHKPKSGNENVSKTEDS